MEPQIHELDEGVGYIGYREASDLIGANIGPLGSEEIPLQLSIHRLAAEDISAQVSYPSADISLKDGFAVYSADIAEASGRQGISLKIIGSAFAGSDFDGRVTSGNAVRVCSGASIPAGADAEVASEFCREISGSAQMRIGAEISCAPEEKWKPGRLLSGKGISFRQELWGLRQQQESATFGFVVARRLRLSGSAMKLSRPAIFFALVRFTPATWLR
jgi:hypothetical protein